jgi:signal transduction histidine kinase
VVTVETVLLEQHILVLAPMGRDAALAVSFFQEAGMAATVCNDMAELTRRAVEGCAAIVIAEEALDRSSLKDFMAMLEQQPSWSEIPITIITTPAESSAQLLRRLTLLGSANITLLERPFRAITLINTARAALRTRKRQYQVRDLLAEREQVLAGLERHVSERTAQLTETNEQLEAFVYTIAHDLRAPLRSMQAFSTLLVMDYASGLDETGRTYAERIRRSAESMDRLVIDLLAYGRVARAELPLGPVDVETAWRAALAQCETDIASRNAVIETASPLPKVIAHDVTLSQVLTNLLSNAVKFARPDVPPLVRFHAEVNGVVTRLWVEDNGIGIAPQYQERIFRIFERLNGPVYGGTGIGLSIVRKGVERMNGRVGLQSTPGEGSRFWIELPKN